MAKNQLLTLADIFGTAARAITPIARAISPFSRERAELPPRPSIVPYVPPSLIEAARSLIPRFPVSLITPPPPAPVPRALAPTPPAPPAPLALPTPLIPRFPDTELRALPPSIETAEERKRRFLEAAERVPIPAVPKPDAVGRLAAALPEDRGEILRGLLRQGVLGPLLETKEEKAEREQRHKLVMSATEKELLRKSLSEEEKIALKEHREELQNLVIGMLGAPEAVGAKAAPKILRAVTGKKLPEPGIPISSVEQGILKEVTEITKSVLPPRVPIITKIKDFATDIQTSLVSEFVPLKLAEKKLYQAKGIEQPKLDIARKFEQLAGAPGKAEADIIDFQKAVIKPLRGKHDDFNQYLFLKRTESRLVADPGVKKVGTWTVQKAQLGLEALHKKVGDSAFQQFEQIGTKTFQNEMDKALRLQVQSGRMSEQTYNAIKASNDFYAPFKVLRHIEEKEAGLIPGIGRKIPTVEPLTKKIIGIQSEDFKIGNILESSAQQIYKSRILAEKNLKMQELVELAKFDTEGTFIQEWKPPSVPVAKIEHRAAIDIDFQEKLVSFARSLGAQFKTTGQAGTKLGIYFPGTQKITRKFATPREVLSHETAHFFDDKYSLKSKFYKRGESKAVAEEMLEFMKRQGESINRMRQPEERFADTFSWWLTHRDLAKRDMPLFSKAISGIINNIPELKPILKIEPSPRLTLEKMQEIIFRPSILRPKDVVTVFFNGEEKLYKVSPEILQAVSGLNQAQTGLVNKTLALAAKPFRLGATTANIAFQFVNLLLADLPRATIMSRYGLRSADDIVRYPIDILHSLWTSLRGNFEHPNELYTQWLRSGAASSTIQKALIARELPEILRVPVPLRTRIGRIVKTPLTTLENMASAIEETSKILGFKRALRIERIAKLPPKEATKKLEEIVTEIRNFSGSPDFARRGKDTKDLNLLFMFFNARIQGTVADFSRLAGATGKKEAVAAWARLSTIVGIPSVSLALLNNSPGYKEDYEAIPEWERDNNFMIPRDKFFTDEQGRRIRDYWRIPKREIVKVFGNLIESGTKFASDQDPNAFTDYAIDFLETISPVNIQGKNWSERVESVIGSLNPLFKAPIEYGLSRNTFSHRDTIPQKLKNRSPELQFTKTTPEHWKQLAQMMPKFLPESFRSPLVLQQLAQGLTAGLITQVFPQEPLPGREVPPLPIITRRFIRSQYVDESEKETRLEGFLREQGDKAALLEDDAQRLYEELKTMPKDEANRRADQLEIDNPILYEKVAQIQDNDKKGLTYTDRLLKQLQVKNGVRAQAIWDELSRLPNREEKNAYLDELDKKGFTSKIIYEQLAKLKEENEISTR